MGVLKRVRSCWRFLFYITHEPIVGYQDQTCIPDEYPYEEHPERIQVRHGRCLENVLPRRCNFILRRTNSSPARGDALSRTVSAI